MTAREELSAAVGMYVGPSDPMHAPIVDYLAAQGFTRQTPATVETVEEACEVMHDAYERAAVEQGWETQERSRVPWSDVPEANKATMRAAVAALLAHLTPATQSTASEPTEELVEALAEAAFVSDDLAGHHSPGPITQPMHTWQNIPEVGRQNYRRMIRDILAALAAREGGRDE